MSVEQSERSENNATDAALQSPTTASSPEESMRIRERTLRKVLRALVLGAGLLGLLFLGGAGIAWVIQGPIFYEHKELTLDASVIGNGPNALGIQGDLVKDEQQRENFVDTRHWLVLSYPECKDAVQGFWVPDEAPPNAKRGKLLKRLRDCFVQLDVGSTVSVKLKTRRRKSDGESSWRVLEVGPCRADQLETLVYPKPDATKCDWM